MKLELGEIIIRDVKFGKPSRIENKSLHIDKEELIKLVLEDHRIKECDIDIAKPGESVRIIPVKDVIEPRAKVSGAGGIFPGIVSPTETVGSGRTHVLRGTAVVTTGRKLVGFQEGLIDMSGPGARYTPFSQTLNVVVRMEPVEGLEVHTHEEAVRVAGLKVAAKLGELGKNIKPDNIKAYELELFPAEKVDLHRVVYILECLSQGLLHDTYVYGVDCKRMNPTIIYPQELMDGAVVSGNCVSGCDKNTTYHHQNDPVVEELFKRHMKDLYFGGVICSPVPVAFGDKVRCAAFAAKLAQMFRADGVIVTEEGFGNPEADLVLICRYCEAMGIKTVLVGDEFAGIEGEAAPLADTTPEADAFVSTGNANEVIELPPMEKVIGDDTVLEVIAGGRKKKNGSLLTEIQAITGSTNGLGYEKLRCVIY